MAQKRNRSFHDTPSLFTLRGTRALMLVLLCVLALSSCNQVNRSDARSSSEAFFAALSTSNFNQARSLASDRSIQFLHLTEEMLKVEPSLKSSIIAESYTIKSIEELGSTALVSFVEVRAGVEGPQRALQLKKNAQGLWLIEWQSDMF